jgi:ribosomal protein S14
MHDFKNLPTNTKKILEKLQEKYPHYSLQQLTAIVSSPFLYSRSNFREMDMGTINIIGLGRIVHLETLVEHAMKRKSLGISRRKLRKNNG